MTQDAKAGAREDLAEVQDFHNVRILTGEAPFILSVDERWHTSEKVCDAINLAHHAAVREAERKAIEALRGTCEWKEDSDGNWDTSCGQTFCVEDGTPADNGYEFCQACGGGLKEIPYKEEAEEAPNERAS